jgi:guanylate kinase
MQRRTPQHPRHYVVTVTTRARRPNETAGISYHYLSLDEYASLRDHDGLLEASEVHGNWYGTPRDQVQSALTAGRDAILKIDVQGAHKVRHQIPGALLIFVVPPSLEELQSRLRGRATETDAALERRLQDAEYELSQVASYDHVVTNETDQVDGTAEEIDAIIADEHRAFPDRRLIV